MCAYAPHLSYFSRSQSKLGSKFLMSACAIVVWWHDWYRICNVSLQNTHLCTSTNPHLILKQSCKTWPQSEPQPNIQMSFHMHKPTYLSGPCSSLTTLSYFPCLLLLASFLSFVPYLCQHWLLSSFAVAYSSLQPIHQALRISVHSHGSLFFFKTNCFSCHGSSSSAIFFPPYISF